MTAPCRRLCLGLALIGLPLAPLAAGEQTARSSQASTPWTAPRAADGNPSLEGVWENNSATPLERPRAARRQAAADGRGTGRLGTPGEDAVLAGSRSHVRRHAVLERFSPTGRRRIGSTGSLQSELAAGSVFRAPHVADRRSSGRPACRRRHRRGLARGRALVARFGRVADVRPGHDAARSLHSLRLSRSVCRVHERLSHRADAGVRRRFRWRRSTTCASSRSTAGRTFRPRCASTWAIPAAAGRATRSSSRRRTSIRTATRWAATSALSDQNLQLIERFRRTAQDTIEYTFTVDNPTMWTKPWTAVINWKASRGELLEYACHEGNYSLPRNARWRAR